MKIKDGFILKKIAGSYIVVPLREQIKNFSAVINLNETGAFIWECLQEDISEDDVAKRLYDEYDIDFERCRTDVKSYIEKLKEAGLLEE